MTIQELLELKESYMSTNDPTEFKFSQESFEGGWEEFRSIRNDPAYADILDQWKYELAVKLESEGIAMMREIARTKKTVAAVKYIADRSWEANLRQTKQGIIDDQIHRTMQVEMDDFANDLALLNK